MGPDSGYSKSSSPLPMAVNGGVGVVLDEVKNEISGIVGLREIKDQLAAIVEKIIAAEKDAANGFRVVPPKPFHMVFLGNNGT
ncbi:hypothetical protein MIMGU_mgv1a0165772mg, partial [Erythranthe guttata]